MSPPHPLQTRGGTIKIDRIFCGPFTLGHPCQAKMEEENSCKDGDDKNIWPWSLKRGGPPIRRLGECLSHSLSESIFSMQHAAVAMKRAFSSHFMRCRECGSPLSRTSSFVRLANLSYMSSHKTEIRQCHPFYQMRLIYSTRCFFSRLRGPIFVRPHPSSRGFFSPQKRGSSRPLKYSIQGKRGSIKGAIFLSSHSHKGFLADITSKKSSPTHV